MLNQLRIIIPAAGYGTRMGMDPYKSKELLPDYNGDPLILSILADAWEFNLPVTVVTRAEKLDLINYLADKTNLEILLIKESHSWLDSVAYASSLHKTEQCIVALPDTTMDNRRDFLQVLKNLRITGPVAGTFLVDDYQNWGIIRQDGTIVDKPYIYPGTREAWGMLVGTSDYFKLLRQGCAPAVWFKYPLTNFKDVTRSKDDYEKYKIMEE